MSINCPYFSDTELELLYENKELLQTHFTSSGLSEFLNALAGEKCAYLGTLNTDFSSTQTTPPSQKEYYNFTRKTFDQLTELLDNLDVQYTYRREKVDNRLGTHNSQIHILVTAESDKLTAEDRHKFKNEALSHREYGKILGYPQSSIEQFIADTNLSDEKVADLYYTAVQKSNLTELSTVNSKEEIPLIYLKSVVKPSPCPPEEVAFYKWDIKRYLNLLEFSKTMATVFGSNHIKAWDMLNKTHSYKISEPSKDNTTLSTNFKKLQKLYVTKDIE